MSNLILASQSARRKQLLEWADIDFEVIVSDADETVPTGMSFEEVAIFIARKKASAIAALESSRQKAIIAADTIVVCNDLVIGKPIDEADAINILRMLSGNVHKVITGVCIIKGNEVIEFSDTTKVEFHSLTEEQIHYYVSTYKPYDKAGAYAIQEWIGVVGIKAIEGDFYNVMGLPVSRVIKALKELS